jgi:citrate lyase subunit gamma (acyl carrier protein)
VKIVKSSVAGTLESSDIHVEVSPGEGLEINLTSIVMMQFGESIKQTIQQVLSDMQIQNVRITAHDRGALDCVIRARVETALARAAEVSP